MALFSLDNGCVSLVVSSLGGSIQTKIAREL